MAISHIPTTLIPLTSGDLVDHLRAEGLTNQSLLMDIEEAIYEYLTEERRKALEGDEYEEMYDRARLLAARVDGNL